MLINIGQYTAVTQMRQQLLLPGEEERFFEIKAIVTEAQPTFLALIPKAETSHRWRDAPQK